MSLESDESQLGAELSQNVKRGIRRVIFNFGQLIILSVLVAPGLLVAETYPEQKNLVIAFVALIWFLGSGIIFYKLMSEYNKSIICPRCHQPYNLGSFGNVPFTKKCQNCGLNMQ
jgi:hypothetical protein